MSLAHHTQVTYTAFLQEVAELPLSKQQHMIQLEEMQEVLKYHHAEANLFREISCLINYQREN